MKIVKAFGTWDTEKIEGNPFATSGSLKVFLTDPKVALIYDTLNARIGFIAVRIAGTDKYTLPKANRTEEEKAITSYYAIYSPVDEWEIKDGGYSPIPGTDADKLTDHMIPASERNAAAKALEHALETRRAIIATSEELPPYTKFPLSQRQMIEQGAHRAEMSIDDYIQTLDPGNRQLAHACFGVDVAAMA